MSKKCKGDEMAAKYWGNLKKVILPPCVGENGGYMNSSSYVRDFDHVYANKGGRHGVLRTTPIQVPEYTAFGIPFRYLTHQNADFVEHQIADLHNDLTPPFVTSWIYGDERQRDILSWFRDEISSGESLCVFYCKNGNPIDENGDRMIVGIGEITKIHPIYDYISTAPYTYPLWEILFEHSIRRNLKDSEGFLIPYHQYINIDDKDIKRITGLSKEEALDEIKLTLDKVGGNGRVRDELSYGCDFISNTSMLSLLQAARYSIEAVIRHNLVGGDWNRQLRWINNQIGRVKSMITPFPSFAEVLRAIGINYSHLIELDLRNAGCGTKDNPWIYFDRLLRGELKVSPVSYTKEIPLYRELWHSQSNEAKEFLILMSRFEVDYDRISEFIKRKEDYTKIIANPYLISEECLRTGDNYVTTDTIDLGVVADPEIQGECLPEPPSVVETVIDKRRLRSMVIERLCRALDEGDTLMSIQEVEDSLRVRLKEEDKAELPFDILLTARDFFSTEIAYIPDSDPKAIQLKEYYEMERKLESVLRKRAMKDVKNIVIEDWLNIVRSNPNYNSRSERSKQASEQQAAALAMMARKRLSVLAGGAGTGKTAVVRSFLSSEMILNEGVLLLAPTGKARVRLGKEASGDKRIEAKTIAQFLIRNQRYDPQRMEAVSNPGARKYSEARNVIIDECSMLTTKDLFVLLEALDLGRINRIILIGDANQLPPIGAGRPFADLCEYLKDKNDEANVLNEAFASLKTVVRTVNGQDSDILNFASWFSSEKPKKEQEDIFHKIEQGLLKNDLRVLYWENEEDLIEKLQSALCEELECDKKGLGDAIKKYIGTDNLQLLKRNPEKIENLQLLTPVLNPAWGVYALNNQFQTWIGSNQTGEGLQFSLQKIFQGDKVMQLQNEKKGGFPSATEHQLSNGQIGFVDNIRNGYCNVAYSGISHDTFGFTSKKGEEDSIPIELAYAISIHKSQGSDFETVVVVLPKGGRIMSRELIYTALTRAKTKVILLVEDSIHWLYSKSKPESSILSQRNTNLFKYSVRSHKSEIPYVEGLIHRTKPDATGQIHTVRSKSEVIIANELISAGIEFKYEERLPEDEGGFLPDFTFVDDSGETILWEHLGMLSVPEYREAWNRKLEVYEKKGYKLGEKLFTTEDHPNGSIDTTEVLDVINRLKDIME